MDASMNRFQRIRPLVLAAARACLLVGPVVLAAPSYMGLRSGSASAQAAGRYDHYEVYDTDLLPSAEYAARRARVLEHLTSGAAMLVRSADVRNRSADVDYEYRQRNSMLYLTGVTEESSALLLAPRGVMVRGKRVKEVLFVNERNPKREIWNGIRMGPDAAAKVTGIATVLPYSDLNDVLDSMLGSTTTLYYDAWAQRDPREPLTGTVYAWETEMVGRLKGRFPGLTVRRAADLLSDMRMVKSAAEIELMRKAAEISVVAHRETIRAAVPGVHEYELEATMEYHFRRQGAEEPGYPSIVGSGPNTCILHYETNRRRTAPGDLVLMDCGAEYHGYSADVTRTFPVSGTFTPEQRAIYDLVLQAQIAGIDVCRAGNNFQAAHRVAVDIISAGLVRLGIITSPEQYRTYFMHGTSHFLGLDVHDVGTPGTLKPGMVLTVEPGVYIAAGSPCDRKWWNIGVRIEDDILVTDADPVNLSGGLERAPEAIEALMRSGGAKSAPESSH